MSGDTPDVGLSEDEREALRNWLSHWGAKYAASDVFTAVEAILRTRLAAVEAAHARDHAALRERAEVAESKVAAVERLCEDLHEDAQAITNTNVEALAHRGALQDVRRRVLVTLADRPAGGEGR